MRICGLQKLSMVDYPGKLAATVFTGGCNLRCPFCHNAAQVTGVSEAPTLSSEEVLDFLASRRGLLDGVVLSGGEPLLHPDAADFLQKVGKLGFAVKLDTNGCYPDALADILNAGIVDYVAMDIKSSPAGYAGAVGVPDFDLAPVRRSAAMLMEGRTDYEFRTTVVRELHTRREILEIGQWLRGARRYVLQCFVDSGGLIAQGLHGLEEAEMEALAQAARPFFGQVSIRGL